MHLTSVEHFLFWIRAYGEAGTERVVEAPWSIGAPRLGRSLERNRAEDGSSVTGHVNENKGRPSGREEGMSTLCNFVGAFVAALFTQKQRISLQPSQVEVTIKIIIITCYGLTDTQHLKRIIISIS